LEFTTSDTYCIKAIWYKLNNLNAHSLSLFVSHGERFDRTRHTVGTEVKAITFSNMRIKDTHPFDIYVVVDI
jgi:SHS2 domain-containing protein